MRELQMQKKDNNSLLKPGSAVEDFLDTLLQESTEKFEIEQPVRLKSKIILMPDLEVKPSEPEIEVEQEITQDQEVAIETDEQLQQKSEPSIQPANYSDYNFPLQCLMFSVAGNQLSIPLINMGSVLAWDGRLTMLPGSPDWFLGILQHRDLNVRVADTAKIIQIDKNTEQLPGAQHILVFGDDNWAITCDNLGDVIKLNEDEVKWTKQGSRSLSLGTIKDSLAILLDPAKILNRLNGHDEKRVTTQRILTDGYK